MTQQPNAPAGWHRQPDGRERYWNGQEWTDQWRASGVGQLLPATVATTPAKKRRPWLVPTIAGVLGLLFGVGIGGAGKSTATTSTASPTVTVTKTVTSDAPAKAAATVTVTPTLTVTVTAAPAPPKVAMSDGVYVVGADLQPGTYRTVEPVSNCYWEITKSGTNGGDIIANDNVDGGRPTVTLKAGQDFKSSRCGDWTKTG